MPARYLIECALFCHIVDYGNRQLPSQCLIDSVDHACRLFPGSHRYDNVETRRVWSVLDVIVSFAPIHDLLLTHGPADNPEHAKQ